MSEMNQQKKMFKVLSPMPKSGGGTWWMRVGTAFLNRDDSINVVLDAMPKDLKFQIREFDEEDLRKRGAGASPPLGAPPTTKSSGELPF